MSKTIIKVNDQLYVDLEDISVLTRYIATHVPDCPCVLMLKDNRPIFISEDAMARLAKAIEACENITLVTAPEIPTPEPEETAEVSEDPVDDDIEDPLLKTRLWYRQAHSLDGNIPAYKKQNIHLYIDNSGSLVAGGYSKQKDHSIKIIDLYYKIAKLLSCKLFITTFACNVNSTYEPNLDSPIETIRDEFKRFLDKEEVGGTDYEEVVKHINESTVRRREVSIIISDYEGFLPENTKIPKNLFFECHPNAIAWDYVDCDSARDYFLKNTEERTGDGKYYLRCQKSCEFAEGMKLLEPNEEETT